MWKRLGPPIQDIKSNAGVFVGPIAASVVAVVLVVTAVIFIRRRRSRAISFPINKHTLLIELQAPAENGLTPIEEKFREFSPVVEKPSSIAEKIPESSPPVIEKAPEQIHIVTELSLASKLGEGKFGEGREFMLCNLLVYLATASTGEIVAAKKLKDPAAKQEFEKEIFTLRFQYLLVITLSKIGEHPNIVRFMGIYSSPQSEQFLVFEYCSKGDLLEFIKKKPLPLTNQVDM